VLTVLYFKKRARRLHQALSPLVVVDVGRRRKTIDEQSDKI
jgi:hypothetical protein